MWRLKEGNEKAEGVSISGESRESQIGVIPQTEVQCIQSSIEFVS